MTKKAGIYNGINTVSLTSDVGKTGQTLAKNAIRPLSHTIYKNKLKID